MKVSAQLGNVFGNHLLLLLNLGSFELLLVDPKCALKFGKNGFGIKGFKRLLRD